jgi:hypothetical protein
LNRATLEHWLLLFKTEVSFIGDFDISNGLIMIALWRILFLSLPSRFIAVRCSSRIAIAKEFAALCVGWEILEKFAV